MKKIVLFISVLVASALFSSNASAQGKFGPDSAECIKYLSYYTEYYKQKNYDSALPNWRKAYALCPPTSRYTLLSDGTTLLRREISKVTTSPEHKEALIDSLMTVYKQRVELWPKYRTSSLNNMALDMYNYMKNDSEAIYKGLGEVIAQNGPATKPNIFVFHFNAACNLYQQGVISDEQVMADYETDADILAKCPTKNEIEAKLVAKSLSDLEKLFVETGVASCDKLLATYTPKFEANPDDLGLAKTIARMLGKAEDCNDNELYLNAVTSIYKQEPSATSAYYLFRLYSARGDMDNAIKYMEEAIASPESDNETDAQYWYELASVCMNSGKSSTALSAANKAIDLSDTYDGKAYMLIAQLWASAPCGGEIGSRAKFWVAVDFMNKAKNADPSLEEAATKAISQYSAYYPKTDVAFMYDLTNGQGYTVSCGGMRASTTVRTNR